MKIAVVILNWNGRVLLERFLPSVVSYSQEAKVYVADNASEDDSVSFVQQHYPEVGIIRNEVNGGYARGYNDALQHLDEDIFILLNSDVEVTENWLKPMLEEFTQHPETAAVQPKILDLKRRDLFEYAGAAGGYIDRFGYPFCRGRIFDTIERDEGQYDDRREIFWASGACLAIRKEDFHKAGRLDEDYFAHQEEIDLCWRLFNQNRKVVYRAEATVYHLGGATLDSMNPRKTFFNFRNSLFSLLKNAPGKKVWGIIFFRLVLDGIAGLKFLFEGKFGHTWAIVRAHFSFYTHISRILKKREKNPKKPGYFLVHSILWKYYLNKKAIFREL